MLILSPSALSADFARLGADVSEIAKAGAPWIHLDVMDGLFVPNISIGIPVIKSLRKASDLYFDVHLMIVDPIRYIKAFADAGADHITFHVEAAEDPAAVLKEIRKYGKKTGITLKPATPLSSIEPYLDDCDMVLIMSVEPGAGGQAYIPESTQKIADLKKMRDERGLSFDIEVDGGVKKDNVHVVLEAGANVIVAGSAVFKDDIGQNVKDFESVFAKYE